jgi:cytochrome c
MRAFFILLMLFAHVPASYAAAIHDAAMKGDVAAITAALDSGADVNAFDMMGASPLYWAARMGHLTAAKLLIERGADVNGKTDLGQPLTAAVTTDRIELISLLLANGADANSNSATETVLHIATANGCLGCVKALVEAGADVNAQWIQEPNVKTPLHLAKLYDHHDIADYLMSHGVVLPRPAPISAKLASADVEKGQSVYKRECGGCHFAEPARKGSGPNLWNVVGRDKASLEFGGYSKTLLALEGVWTYEDLNTFLYGPTLTTPGVVMTVRGAPDEIERIDLIAFLRTLSDNPIPLP